MKLSLNSIRDMNKRYGCADNVLAIGVDELVKKIGTQLGAVEEVIKLGDRYQGIVIAEIVACGPHPNADKLQVCTINDGGVTKGLDRDAEGNVQVVCGAPNARLGITVAWLPPGSTVPETFDKEPFVLEARELRGVVSNGMLASPRELGLGDNHDGILEIGKGYAPGTDFAEAFGLKDDVVLDIENKMFTHRPDCFGFLGVSRELAGIQGLAFKSPEWYQLQPAFPLAEGDQLALQIRNELPELVPRFSVIAMSNITIEPSPLWLQIELAKLGQKSINNVVDYTNFFMQETGQPLHAYDYDKVKQLSDGDGVTMVVRHPQKGEDIALLNGKTIEPRAEAIMIASDRALIGVGGVMGGSDTEVDANTKNIILECGTFNMYSIRRTSMAHGLFTDAVTRFNKGQSPLQNLAVLAKIVNEIKQYVGGKVASELVDDKHFDDKISVHPPVAISKDFINARLGLELGDKEITELLTNVEFIVAASDDQLTVTAPFWRTDIELPEDVVEEVGRLYGYDHLPLVLPRRDITPTVQDPLLTLRANIRARLAKAGANEVLTYSFVHGNLLQKVGQDAKKAFQISNALSPDLQYYRLSLLPSLLDKVHANIKAGYDQFALFELGKSHQIDQLDDNDLPFEFERTALVFAAADKLKKTGAAYYEAREYLLAASGIRFDFKPLTANDKQALTTMFNPDRAALVILPNSDDVVGVIGEFKPAVSRALKLPAYCAGFEVDTVLLGEAMAAQHGYVALPRFPKVSQDITLKVPATLAYQELFSFVWRQIEKLQPADSLPTLQPLDIYQKADDTEHKQITLRLTLSNYSRTLTDKEVTKLLDAVTTAAAQLGASRV
jgi:phenylalanyl-tRNA synthetase beta chain